MSKVYLGGLGIGISLSFPREPKVPEERGNRSVEPYGPVHTSVGGMCAPGLS